MDLILMAIVLVVIVYIIYQMYYRENYRMYFGSGVTPLINKCPAPFCGDPTIGYSEEYNYPYLVANNIPELTNERDSLIKHMQLDSEELGKVVHLSGSTLEPNDLIISNDDIKQGMLSIADESQKGQDTSTGMALAAVPENFELYDQAPSSMNWSDAGRLVYDHPDVQDFNKMYYSNPSRTVGISDNNQAIVHFNELAAYYGNVQGQVPVSEDAINWNDQYNPQVGASELFDINPRYSSLVDDPKEATVQDGYSRSGNAFKKRVYFDDLYDNAIRRRNQTKIESFERGSGITNKSRDIMDTVFGPDMDEYEKSQWMSRYEP